ncbi:MAG: peptidoglycan DD-metalloendopeptidase family protein [Lautropia sp.]|nr:peptidoglycan DD-metalloendopeptidase family protein [Lautropia sp.]
MHSSPGKRLASALGAALSVATLTAFAVAPLTEEAPPHARVIQPVALNPLPMPTTGAFHREVTVGRGESVVSLLRKLGQEDDSLIDFLRRNPTTRKLLTPAPGSAISAVLDQRNQIQSLSYPLPASAGTNGTSNGKARAQRLEITQRNGRWQADIREQALERRLVSRSAEVSTTLFSAADDAGIPAAITARIDEIFGAELDFHRDVKKGDRIRLVYEMFVNPNTLDAGQPGRILAIEYQSGNKRMDALWFNRADGTGDYYGFDGHALKRRFLRSPLEYSRITSGFSLGRRHPVFRDWRAHKGVDYAAPTGAKIRTVGDGVVEFIGTQRGYGNVVIVRHDNQQSTLYAHMNRFAPKLRQGDKVEQGQFIGEVGSSGWATGPHLHFEFLVNGQQIDPTTMLPQPAQPLDVPSRTALLASADKLIGMMRQQEATKVAAFE